MDGCWDFVEKIHIFVSGFGFRQNPPCIQHNDQENLCEKFVLCIILNKRGKKIISKPLVMHNRTSMHP